MSNALAVATVTATLARVLDEALAAQGDGGVSNVHTTTLRPDMLAAADGAARGVNVFLYEVTPNGAWRDADLPTRRGDGTLVTRPQQALDLHYLLTFSGEENELEPQRLLGLTVTTLAAQPVLSRELVRHAITHGEAPEYLSFSDLADQIDVVRLTMSSLNLEEMSKLWSTFFQASYRLSVPYQATVVLLENGDTPQTALPVRSRNLDAADFRAPSISKVVADSAPADPVTSATVIRVEGQRLRGTVSRVRITGPGGVIEADPPPADVTDTRITLPLPVGVLAGVNGLQILQPFLVGDPPEERAAAESNAALLLVSPSVAGTVTTALDPVTGVVRVGVPVEPPVGARQRVALFLNEIGAPPDRPARAYSFVAPARTDPATPDPATTVAVTTREVADGDYLVRIQVDGVASPLEVGADGRFDAPAVTFP
ncbi:MAG TPA: DUF4255 domain-containing protein [Nocardioidaceae bacterium]|nr:DUF4255 domain-containing protein [Nocardioidaceae bacterium]